MKNIEFFRIDGDKNDLPWYGINILLLNWSTVEFNDFYIFRQFTMPEYPSLVIFPGDAKTESRKYPSELSINNANVLGFVLANLSRGHRLLGLVMACNKVNFS